MKTPFDIDAKVEDFANPHSSTRAHLRHAENQAGKADSAADNIRHQEETGSGIRSSLHSRSRRTGSSKSKRSLRSKFMRGTGSIVTVLALLFGGGAVAILSSSSLAIVEMKEVFTQSLNDQLHAVDSRSTSIFKAKMKGNGPDVCGSVKICKNFETMSTTEVKKFEKGKNGIKIDRDMIDKNRGKVTKITYTNDTGNKLEIKSPDELQKALSNNVDFKAAWTKGYNPKYASLSDSVMSKVLFKLKATKNEDISGKNDEERRKKVNQAVGGYENNGAKPINVTEDKDGNKTYTDENGHPIAASDVEAAQEMEKRIEDYTKNGGTAGVLKKAAVGGVMVDGAADTACSVYSGIRHVSAISKLVKAAQAARYVMAMVFTPADRIKAGVAQENDTNFVGNTIMATSPSTQVLDESKLSQTASSKPPTITSTTTGNAFDSKGYKLASGEKIGKLTMQDSRFMLGGGAPSVLDRVTTRIARVVNGGNPDPNALSKKCGYIQSWFVRGGALAAGFITGAATLGISTLVIGGASFAVQLVMPLIESSLGDIIAGNVFKDISGYDTGNAGYVGASAVLGSVAQDRGMAPVNSHGGEEYLAANRQTNAQYASLESYMARTTPFDIYNPHSFLGSVAFGLIPTVQQSRSSAIMAMMNIANLVPKTFGSIMQPVGALSDDYFGHCNDPMYQSLGIQAGPFCEVRYYMSDQELAMDPVQNAVWMAKTGNIDPASDTGQAKDNGETWNYAKFLDECVNRTAGWGEPQDETKGDGRDCIDPKNQQLNDHFRVYTMDLSLNNSMDQTDQTQTDLPGTSGFADGQTSKVGKDGWAYPTVNSDGITFGFVPGHEGVNIAADTDAATAGQPIFAAYDGTVVAAGPSQTYGNWIVLEHTVKGKTMSTVYAYMNDNGVLVHQGDKVKAGQEIGRIGTNGSGGRPYLYFELWNGQALGNGTRTDPTDILNGLQTGRGVSDV